MTIINIFITTISIVIIIISFIIIINSGTYCIINVVIIIIITISSSSSSSSSSVDGQWFRFKLNRDEAEGRRDPSSRVRRTGVWRLLGMWSILRT